MGHRVSRLTPSIAVTAALAITLVCAVRPAAAAAATDDLAEFQLAMNAYDTGEYAVAEQRFGALLSKEPPLENAALVFEVRKFLAAALMFLGKQAEAEVQFEALLRQDPDYELNPVLFPTEVLDAFTQVKVRLAEELAAIQKDKEEAAAKAAAEKKAKKEQIQKAIQEAAKPVYLVKNVEKRYAIVALVPFGVGQLQNGQKAKGYVFMGGEIALLATNITLWSVCEYFKMLYRSTSEETPRRTAIRNTATNYKLATNIVGGVLIGAIVAGIIDALVYWARLEKKQVTFTPVDPKEVPDGQKMPPPVIPESDIDLIVGVTLSWSFGG